MSTVARRTLIASAWAAPVVIATAAMPAFAASLSEIPVESASSPAGSAQSYLFVRVTNPGATPLDVTVSVPITAQYSQSFVYPPWARTVTAENVLFTTTVAGGATTSYGDFSVVFLRPVDPPDVESITVPVTVTATGYAPTVKQAVVAFE